MHKAVLTSKDFWSGLLFMGMGAAALMSPHDFKELYLYEMAQLGPLIKSMNLVIE